MSIGKQLVLSGATGTGAGTAYSFPTSKVTFHIEGITTATVAVQASNDGSNWITLGSVTADGILTVSDPYVQLRANVTAYTTGTISVTAAVDDY